MLIPYFLSFELLAVLGFVYFLEYILEATIVLLQDGVFSGEIKGVLSGKCKFETALSKLLDTLVSVVHRQTHAALSFKTVHFCTLLFSAFSSKNHLKRPRLIDCKISSLVLITKSVSSDDDRFFPSRDESGNVFDDDGFSEDGAI